MNEIDIKDWERNTVYDGYTKNDITIINFWKVIFFYNNMFLNIYIQIKVSSIRNLLYK